MYHPLHRRYKKALLRLRGGASPTPLQALLEKITNTSPKETKIVSDILFYDTLTPEYIATLSTNMTEYSNSFWEEWDYETLDPLLFFFTIRHIYQAYTFKMKKWHHRPEIRKALNDMPDSAAYPPKEGALRRLQAFLQILRQSSDQEQATFANNLLTEVEFALTSEGAAEALKALDEEIRNTQTGWNQFTSRKVHTFCGDLSLNQFFQKRSTLDTYVEKKRLSEEFYNSTKQEDVAARTEQEERLRTFIGLFREKARISGFDDQCDFSSRKNMIRRRKDIDALLEETQRLQEAPFTALVDRVRAMLRLEESDKLYAFNLLPMIERYSKGAHAHLWNKAFHMRSLMTKMLGLMAKLFDVTCKDVTSADRYGGLPLYEVSYDGILLGTLLVDMMEDKGRKESDATNVYADILVGRCRLHGIEILPVVRVAGKFLPDKFLSHHDVRQMFHELGHAIHFLIAEHSNPFISRADFMPQDFKEMLAMLFEDLLEQPELLKSLLDDDVVSEMQDDTIIQRFCEGMSFESTRIQQLSLYYSMLFIKMFWDGIHPDQSLRDSCAHMAYYGKVENIPGLDFLWTWHPSQENYNANYYVYTSGLTKGHVLFQKVFLPVINHRDELKRRIRDMVTTLYKPGATLQTDQYKEIYETFLKKYNAP